MDTYKKKHNGLISIRKRCRGITFCYACLLGVYLFHVTSQYAQQPTRTGLRGRGLSSACA